ncbi:MAG: thiamine pyrophosphate-binding protein [Geminicoccaceae bacterium]|jgi:acetolactate synthase-1/2/3 large subunit|nr:thiamine pyrophosphate-binding protein [Geminicoccaceae bacterium]HRY26575.1 thiamine pyrophosphate-binding protein [Geminicoccaceae bacterium]
MTTTRRSGGEILIDELVRHGTDRIFGVPGESYLAALDALHGRNDIAFVICRQEGGAAMMAEADGKLTGRPGVCFVTRGPGATNASAGVHIARQDSTPMILLVGQIAREARDREAFQEVDYRQMFGGIAKWVAEIEDARRIPEYLHRAFMTATTGRPGPVVLALPEDMLTDEVMTEPGRPWQQVRAHPDPAAVETTMTWLGEAERPLVILGGGGWDQDAVTALRRFVEANDLPTAVGFRRQDYLDNTHRCYVGDIGIGANPKLLERLDHADLLLVIGARLGEMTSDGYTRLGLPRPKQRMIQVLNGPEELGRVYQPDLLIQASPGPFVEALAARGPLASRTWALGTADGHAAYLENIAPLEIPGNVQMPAIMAELRATLPAEAIVTNGAGNYSAWCNRFYSYRAFRSQLAPTSGSMGYGLPAAIAAKLAHPDRPVVCFAGDGCFLMTGQELATACQQRLAIVILVFNNGMYGTIRMHQEREYPTRVYGTELANPDFARLAEAHGALGLRVERTEAFAPAFAQALAADRPALIEIVMDQEAITPRQSLSAIRAAALARQKG